MNRAEMNEEENALFTAIQLFRDCNSDKHQYQYLLKSDLWAENISYQNKKIDEGNDEETNNAKILYENMMLLGLNEKIAINERLKFRLRRKKTKLYKIVLAIF